MTLEGLEVGMRLETRAAMKRRYAEERAVAECRECAPRACDCWYECTVCGASRRGRPNHPGGKCPEDLA